MKTSKILYLCLLFPVFCSCGDNKDQKDGQNTLTTEQQASVHRMKDYDLTDSVTMGNHLFVYTIHREADDSLKAVVDENGDKYVDNYYDLTILRDGTNFSNEIFVILFYFHVRGRR